MALRLVGEPYSLRPTDILKMHGITSGTATYRIDKLTKQELAESIADLTDRHGYLISGEFATAWGTASSNMHVGKQPHNQADTAHQKNRFFQPAPLCQQSNGSHGNSNLQGGCCLSPAVMLVHACFTF